MIPQKKSKTIAICLALASTLIATTSIAQTPNSKSAPALKFDQLQPLPDPVGFAGPYAGTSNGALIVAGGANFGGKDNWAGAPKQWHDRIFVLEKPDGTWKEAGKLPKNLGYGVTVTWKNQVICVGGENADGMHADAFAISWEQGKVRTEVLPALPQALGYTSGALLGDTIYVIGGNAGKNTIQKSVWSMDLAKPAAQRRWISEESWPGPALFLAVAGTDGNHLYLFGGAELYTNWRGQVDRIFHKQSYKFTPGKGWVRIADMPATLAAGPSPAPMLNGELMVMGGDDGGLFGRSSSIKHRHPGFPSSVYAYDTQTDKWRLGTSMPLDYGPDFINQPGAATMPPVTTGTVMWHGKVIIPSGEIRPGVRTNRILSAQIE
jgi:SSS family solute:Na+ symporter